MKIIVTGGAGFIGCNAVAAWIAAGHEVVVIDDLSRRGTDSNMAWLKSVGAFTFHKQDIRDAAGLAALFREHKQAGAVVHLAAQVAVTTSWSSRATTSRSTRSARSTCSRRCARAA